jgi:hypothetical protein
MPLIECPECGREVSSNALACPACAFPVATWKPSEPDRAAVRRKRQERAKLALQILGRLAIGAVLFGVGVGEDESGAAAIGAIIIAGSAIPVWVRARAAQLGKGGAAGLEERVAAMEQRHREQMEELARMQADHVADLEERVDFAERLLTKQRDQTNP